MDEVTASVAGATQASAEAGETIRALSETLLNVSQAATKIVAGSDHQVLAMAQTRQATSQIEEISRQQLLAAQMLQDSAQDLHSRAAELAALAETA